jgi:hypothetical protein
VAALDIGLALEGVPHFEYYNIMDGREARRELMHAIVGIVCDVEKSLA